MRIHCALLRFAMVAAPLLFTASLLSAQDSANLLLQGVQATSQTVPASDLKMPVRLKNQYEKALGLLLNKHDTKQSIATIQNVIDQAPSFSLAHFLLGMIYMNTAKWAAAEAELRKVIALNDRSGFAFLALGSSLFEQGELLEAEQALLRASELIPQVPRVRYELARTYYALQRFAESELQARQTVRMDSTFAEGHMVLGYALLRLQRNQEAFNELRAYLSMEPDGPASIPIQRFMARWSSTPTPQRCDECTAD